MESYLISIHAPREGGDHTTFRDLRLTVGISIHAPREGGDRGYLRQHGLCRTDFNPRPPRGGRQVLTSAPSMPRLFQSTPPARGATCRVDEEKPVMSISIHAPREGGDGKQKGKVVDVKISIHAPREGGDSKDAQFYPRIFDK